MRVRIPSVQREIGGAEPCRMTVATAHSRTDAALRKGASTLVPAISGRAVRAMHRGMTRRTATDGVVMADEPVQRVGDIQFGTCSAGCGTHVSGGGECSPCRQRTRTSE